MLTSSIQKKKLILKITARLEAGKELEFICNELEKYFSDHTFHAIKKREIQDGYKSNPNYGP